MRVVFSLFLALSLLPACGPATPPGECSESAKVTGYRDEDGDGQGNPATQELVCAIGVGGWVSVGIDCDDTRSSIYKGALEECDGLDNNCNNDVDEGLRQIPFYLDADGDGYGNIDQIDEACSPQPGYVENSADCDDGDPLSFPGSDEFCDGEDNDCDGLVDDEDPDVDRTSMPWWYQDGDNDTYGDPDAAVQRCDSPGPTYVDNDLDCNDSLLGISPDAQEVCDALDNDCDGLIDDSDPSLNNIGIITWYYDSDGDGLGNPGMPLEACNQPWFYVGDNRDCDDTDPFILTSTTTFWRVDSDADTYGDPDVASVGPSCLPPGAGFTPEGVGDDCDDTLAAINPGATEVCDGLDNDCDLLVDDLDDSLDESSTLTFYPDVDGDGFGDPTQPVEACTQPPNTVSDFTDCDDTEFTVHLGAPEICNSGVDDNCNGLADAADPTLDPLSAPNWYVDFDMDGFGCPEADCGVTIACTQPLGQVANDVDCDDNDNTILGDVDWLADDDDDGFGAGAAIGSGCIPPNPDAVADLGPRDCDDTDPNSYPGADEICGDTIDQDCDGPDQACPPDTCADAGLFPLVIDDTRFVDDLTTYANDINLANFNSCTGHGTNGNDAIIPVQVQPGENFSARLTGAGDVVLTLLTTCTAPNPSTDCRVGSDNTTVNSETLWYTNRSAVPEDLFLVADCNGPCTGYELDLDFNVIDLPDTCAGVVGTPVFTTGGYSVRGDLSGYADNSDLGSLGCTGIDSSGGEAFLPIDLLSGQAVNLTSYTQFLDDSSAYLVSSCADPFGTCLVGSDASGAGQSESLSYTNGGASTSRVYLALDCYLPTCREFTAKFVIQ